MAPVNHSKNQGADGVRTVSKCYPPPQQHNIFISYLGISHNLLASHSSQVNLPTLVPLPHPPRPKPTPSSLLCIAYILIGA